jgi:hypothetical protein
VTSMPCNSKPCNTKTKTITTTSDEWCSVRLSDPTYVPPLPPPPRLPPPTPPAPRVRACTLDRFLHHSSLLCVQTHPWETAAEEALTACVAGSMSSCTRSTRARKTTGLSSCTSLPLSLSACLFILCHDHNDSYVNSHGKACVPTAHSSCGRLLAPPP